MHVRRLAVVALAALLAAATPARAIEGGGPLYVIVPFGQPGEVDPVEKQATHQLNVDLAQHQIRSIVAPPLDPIEAVGTAHALCGTYNASGVLVSQLRFEQSKERNLSGFIPVVGGAISSSGVLDRSPITARLRLYLVDCDGVVRWKTYTMTNKVHKGTNVAAGLTEIANEALAEAVDSFASRPPSEARPQAAQPVPPSPEPRPSPSP